MKCNKCNEEIFVPAGKNVKFCQNCGEPVPKAAAPAAPPPTDNVLKALAQRHGEDLLLDSSKLTILVKAMLNKTPQLLKRVKLAIGEGVPELLNDLKQAGEQERISKMTAIAATLTDSYGMEIGAATELVNYFAEAFGFERLPVSAIKVASPPPAWHGVSSELTSAPQIGGIVRFASYDWRVLDVDPQDGNALLLCEKVIDEMAYSKRYSDVTWADSEIRSYLNGLFLNKFNPIEKARIAETWVTTTNNSWWPNISGGNATTDKVFLLSIKETVKYFGDSGQMKNPPQEGAYWIDDQYNAARIAYNEKDEASWWWLRSPGCYSYRAACIGFNGYLNILGIRVRDKGGVRPAVWLKLA